MINGTLLEDVFLDRNTYKYLQIWQSNIYKHKGTLWLESVDRNEFPIYAMLNSHLYPKYNLCIFSIYILQ